MGSAGRTSWGDAYDTDGNGPDVRRCRQPVPLASGEEALAGGLDCFLQDIRLEALTMEGECFFDSDYGWSLLDFCHREIGELEELQIRTGSRKS